jgi:TetR/AcrR family transcriptional regulator, transcriptional repressor for nem operon
MLRPRKNLVQMKRSKQETAETRKRIVETAATEFRRNGIDGTGLADLMGAAGLTHGGFYRHFDSKDHLVAESCAAAVDSVVESLTSALSKKRKRSGLEAVAGSYLAKDHRDNSSNGCPFAALASELVRSDDSTRAAATKGFLKLVDIIAAQLGSVRPDVARGQALVVLCTMIGAVTMARLVTDPELSSAILRQTEKQLTQSYQLMRGLPWASTRRT